MDSRQRARKRQRDYEGRVSELIGDLSDDELLDRWRSDLERHFDEVTTVFLNRIVFVRLHESLVAAKGSSVVSEYLKRSYLSTQSVAIRRLVDPDVRALSLLNTLTEMLLKRKALTRQAFIESAPRRVAVDQSHASDAEALRRLEASAEFDRIVGPNAKHVHAKVLRQALQDLAELHRVKRVVDTQIAHADRRPTDPMRWDELHGAIDALEKHLNSIARLVTGAWYAPSSLAVVGDWEPRFQGDPTASG